MEQDLEIRRTSSSTDREIEELLIDIVRTTSGGEKLHLGLVERIFQQRTGFALSTLSISRTIPENWDGSGCITKQAEVLEYVKSILTVESPLRVNCGDGCLSLYCEESTLDCSADSEIPLSEVVNRLRISGKITEIDLSRRCFASKHELLEVCKSAKMLRRLIIRDIQIMSSDDKESPRNCELLELIKWYCPALKEVDITGCSPLTLACLHQTKSRVDVLDILSKNPEVKELLVPSHISSDVSNIANKMKALVQEGVPANISNQGWSLLHTASAIGDADLVLWLLENNGNCEFQSATSSTLTPLEIAIYCHNLPIVKQLLDVHKPEWCDPQKVVDLCFLCRSVPNECNFLQLDHHSACNPLEVIKLIIERSSVDFKTAFLVQTMKAFQRVPLKEMREKTCWTEDLLAELLKSLVSSGCSPDIPIADLNGKTPLMCTVSSPVLVKALLDLGSSIGATDQEGNTALFYAAREAFFESGDEHLQVCQILLEANADVNASNNYGETPFLYIISIERFKGHGAGIPEGISRGSSVNIWERLVQWGADISSKTKEHKSVTHLVIERTKCDLEKIQNTSPVDTSIRLSQIVVDQCIERIRFLSECNKQLVTTRDRMGNTPLHVLADCEPFNHAEMVSIARTLVDFGSNINSANDEDKTPLHLAKSWSMAKFLLECGAKPNLLDKMGFSPLICRCKEAPSEGRPHTDTLSKWSDGVNFGLDPWREDKKGQNVFTVLMEQANFADLEFFINATIEKDKEAILKTDSGGNTLLHHLCSYNNSSVRPLVNLVLQRGVNVNAQNKEGDTALHIVCRKIVRLPDPKGDNSVYWKFISPLRSYGAQYNIKNHIGSTVVHIAWFNKKLLRSVRKKVVQREPHQVFPWNPVSKAHSRVLSQVVRRQACHIFENYCYHQDPIGSGAFGNVYAAVNVQDGREVALKRADTYRLRTRQDDREVQTLLRVSNCHQIVKYFDLKRSTDSTWIALELMEGNLDHLLQHQRVEENCLPKLCNDVLCGVKYLHQNDILHRDLKPTNVLYTFHEDNPCLKIADFGLSKNLGVGQGSSVLHSHAGSRSWMAPELLVSNGPLQHTFESDVFACGLILHYILANGRHPFEESNSDDRRSIAHWSAVEQSIINDCKTVSEDLSEEAKDLLMQILNARKDDRPRASDALKHPLFWSEDKKVRFLRAVANQSEIGTFGHSSASLVEHQIENNLRPLLSITSFDTLFPGIYREMTTCRRGRSYVTSSGVHLVRFIRNSYAHVSDRSRPTGFRTALLKDYVFLKKLPNHLMIVYKAVKSGSWDTSREEISSVLQSASR